MLNAGHETTTNLIGNALVACRNGPTPSADLLSKMASGSRRIARPLEANLTLRWTNSCGSNRPTSWATAAPLQGLQVGGVDLPEGRAGDAVHRRGQPRPGRLPTRPCWTCSALATATWPSASASTSARA
jgi:hypothetical protein